jgi:hypothetical protein
MGSNHGTNKVVTDTILSNTGHRVYTRGVKPGQRSVENVFELLAKGSVGAGWELHTGVDGEGSAQLHRTAAGGNGRG